MTKISKGTTKVCKNFTIDKVLFNKFEEIAKKKSINRSHLVQTLLAEWVKEHENN